MTNQPPTIAALRRQFLDGSYTPEEAVRASLDSITAQNTDINAFLDVYDDATKQAQAAGEQLQREGEKAPPLAGIPIAVKNNILIEGRRATASSKMLEHYTATYSATLISRLQEAGAIIVGATNMDEFAMGSSTEHSAFGPTKNPVDPTRVPGGSSGGSAAAVAMGAVPAAIGTDTGGSIRQPASFCGLVGFKPTYGAVSRYGLIAMGSSLDQAGPLTHTVRDAHALHAVMAGQDPMDATTITPDTYAAVPTKDTYTVGVPTDFLGEGVDQGVRAAFDAHLEDIKKLGHEVKEIKLPLFEKGLAAYYIVMPAEVSSNLARFDGIRYGLSLDGESLLDVYENSRGAGFGDEVKRRILLGTYVLSAGYYDAYYAKAELVRLKMREELAEVFKTVDAIALPTAPTPAFKLGAITDPISLYRQDIFTVPVNLTGVPAISLPVGSVVDGDSHLPVGVQYIGPHGGDERLFDIGTKVFDDRG